MSQRVTDEMVRSVLIWARNYGEITEYKEISPRGRRWRIRLAIPRLIGSNLIAGRPQDEVPQEMVFTSREALAFGYGCAVGGIHDRADFARENWGWE